jgi:hypothetical protein
MALKYNRIRPTTSASRLLRHQTLDSGSVATQGLETMDVHMLPRSLVSNMICKRFSFVLTIREAN